ncbi:MAG: GNAT family N-acetyltransferase [Anaerolineae bacterium]|nr:GNAT family N-acetyltransferase [Anaerolineae bacterium]
MADVVIRPMIQADLPRVVDWLVQTPLGQRYLFQADHIRHSLETGLQQTDTLLVADTDRAGGQACGLIWCLPKGAFGRSAYVRLIAVREDHTGHGIGAALLQQAEQVLVASSPDLFLLVSDFNTAAQRFYQRMGYQQLGAIPGYVLADVTELIYWKRLQPST